MAMMNRIHLSRGFTLLELLVAMTLVALVTVIAAMAFRLTIQAWNRVAAEGESRQIQSALPALLEKQLGARVTARMFGNAMINPEQFFCGNENTLSFLTTYAPQGSLLQGVMWVRYEFDPAQKTLMIYLKSVSRLEDLGENAGGFQSKKTNEGYPVSKIHDIIGFRLYYTDDPLYDTNNSKQWQKEWKCEAESAGAPSGLMLEMTIEEGSKARRSIWCYRIGGQQSAGSAVRQ
jgi:prepilin-type N-terminal cleavage/methylation domain-containing protein